MTKEQRREYFRRRYEEAKLAYAAFIECYPFSLDDLPDEQWRPIDGFDKYQVSNFGRVKSFKWTKPRILKPVLVGEYLGINFSISGKLKWRTIHTLVAETFIPNPEGKPEVNHKIGMKFNCHVENLEWATQSENMQHAHNTSLQIAVHGEEHGRAKLTKEQAKEIRDNPDQLSQRALAKIYGVNKATICAIQSGKSWKHVGGIIHEKQKHPRNYIPDEKRAAIRADWVTGNYKSYSALGRKYGCDHKTIIRIVNEG